MRSALLCLCAFHAFFCFFLFRFRGVWFRVWVHTVSFVMYDFTHTWFPFWRGLLHFSCLGMFCYLVSFSMSENELGFVCVAHENQTPTFEGRAKKLMRDARQLKRVPFYYKRTQRFEHIVCIVLQHRKHEFFNISAGSRVSVGMCSRLWFAEAKTTRENNVSLAFLIPRH